MDGPQHYREAERLIQAVTTDPATASVLIAQAQVHALLALAAATAIGTTGTESRAWAAAAGTKLSAGSS